MMFTVVPPSARELMPGLAALFRHYAAAIDLHPGAVDCLCKEFRQDIGLIIAKYGQAAVEKPRAG
jgi:hypothetical protein